MNEDVPFITFCFVPAIYLFKIEDMNKNDLLITHFVFVSSVSILIQ